MKVKIVNKSSFPSPAYATPLSAGMDLRANITEPITLEPLQRVLVPTGLYIALPEGYECQVRPRSGLAVKHGITVLNSPGTVDADYRGEVHLNLINTSNEWVTIKTGQKIVQFIHKEYIASDFEEISVDEYNALEATDRGEGGFSSTGEK